MAHLKSCFPGIITFVDEKNELFFAQQNDRQNQLLHGLKLADSEKMIKKVVLHGDFAGKIILGYG